jgi:hypothetical protein
MLERLIAVRNPLDSKPALVANIDETIQFRIRANAIRN